MKVMMKPSYETAAGGGNGISRVIEAYYRYLPKYGITFTDYPEEADLYAVHAGVSYPQRLDVPIVAHLHGLYFTSDYAADSWEYQANASVIASARIADTITVPSSWVAKIFQRDMRVNPYVLPHGIDADEWRHSEPNEGYVLWNKNRDKDVCDPIAVKILAEKYPGLRFLSTFAPTDSPPNVLAVGTKPHDEMRLIIQCANIYLSTTKETFGIGILEALAAGVPVLGWAYGGNLDTVKHGVDGYLARPGNYDDLAKGLSFCLKYRDVLGSNAQELVKQFTWDKVAERLANIYQQTYSTYHDLYDREFVLEGD